MKYLALLLTLRTATAVTTAVGAANTAATTAAAAVVASSRNQHDGHHTSSAGALLFVLPSAPRTRGWVTGSARSDAVATPSPRRAWRSSWGDSDALKHAESKRDLFLLPGSGGLRMTSASAGEGDEDGDKV